MEENTIQVCYPSLSAKNEFDQVQAEFFNHFKHKVNNYKIKLEFSKDETLVEEILTKKKVFENLTEINPLLKDLNDFMLFDLS